MENVGRFSELHRRDENEAALLVFHSKETRKKSGESTNLKMTFSLSRAYIDRSFMFFAVTSVTGLRNKVRTLFDGVPVFPKNKGHFQENKGHFQGNSRVKEGSKSE